MTTSKSPLAIATVAYAVAQKTLKKYSNKFSRHTFILPQLMACLVLKEFFSKDYRGITAIIADSNDIQKALELKTTPHFTTLQKAEARVFSHKQFVKLMKTILKLAEHLKIQPAITKLAAIDSTGFETRHISKYFVTRRHYALKNTQKTQYSRYPKADILCNTANHLILAGKAEWGPNFDAQHLPFLVGEATHVFQIRTLVADRGYDGETSHVLLREHYGIESIIRPWRWKASEKLPATKYRRLMVTNFNKKKYGQRWQVETVHSMIKRLQASFLRARTYWNQCREILLRLFTHNVMIVVFR